MNEAYKRQAIIETLFPFINGGYRVYAVADGAIFPELQDQLPKINISFRSLYKFTGNPHVLSGGPWAINPHKAARPSEQENTALAQAAKEAEENDRDVSEYIAEKMNSALKNGDQTGAGLLQGGDYQDSKSVFERLSALVNAIPKTAGLILWICNPNITFEVFYAHMRRHNRIWVPRASPFDNTPKDIAGAAISPYTDFEHPTHNFVLFRHTDANVLAQILPIMDSPEREKFLGPCHLVLFYPDFPWGERLLNLHKNQETKPEMSRPLMLSETNMNALQAVRKKAFERTLMASLLTEYPKLKTIKNDIFREKVRQYLRPCRYKFFFVKTDHIYQAVAINILYEDTILKDAEAQTLLRANDVAPDYKLRVLRQRYPLVKEDI